MEDDPLEHLPACRPNWKTKLPLVPSPRFGFCLCLGNHNAVYALDWEAKGLSCMSEHACCIFFHFRIHARAEAGKFGNLPIILCF